MHATPARRAWILRAFCVCVVALLAAVGTSAHAGPKYAGIVIDVNSGEVLYQEDADEPRYPASLTKMMTIYIAFEELAARRMTVDTPLSISTYAAGRPPSKIGVRPGTTIALGDAIKALVTKSANDAAVVIAEGIEGSETAFARRMTRTARRLGMSKTTFRNANGLPDTRQTTTARDMATLGIALQRDFPQYYGVFKTRSFTYGRRTFGNHNRLLSMEGVDGIKTGYIRDSGFNLVSSIRRDGKHLVATVMGGRTGASRDSQMRSLLAKYLPAATVGSEMLVASWQDRAPPPVPGKKPPLSEIYAARLIARAAAPDPIAETLLAYAADSAGERPQLILPERATGALSAVVAEAVPGGGTLTAVAVPSPAPRGDLGASPVARVAAATVAATAVAAAADDLADPLAAYADAGASGPERAANLMADTPAPAATPAVVRGGGGERFAVAFATFETVSPAGRLRREDVLAAVERALPAPDRAPPAARRPALTIASLVATAAPAETRPAPAEVRPARAAKGDAQAPAPAGTDPAGGDWQIQIGAVGSAREADALLADAASEVPDLAAYQRVTVTVTTDRGTFYRARFAGFASESEAKHFCERFSNHNRPCWAVAM